MSIPENSTSSRLNLKLGPACHLMACDLGVGVVAAPAIPETKSEGSFPERGSWAHKVARTVSAERGQ